MSNLNSTDKLTEFPSLERDERPDGRFSSLSKFLFWRKGGMCLVINNILAFIYVLDNQVNQFFR